MTKYIVRVRRSGLYYRKCRKGLTDEKAHAYRYTRSGLEELLKGHTKATIKSKLVLIPVEVS